MSNFEEIYSMTPHELKKLDIDILVKHIFELRGSITSGSDKLRCLCGEKKHEVSYGETHPYCYCCRRILCGGRECYDVCDCCEGRYTCQSCIEQCKHCSNKICKNCIYDKYSDWNISGCITVQRKYDCETEQYDAILNHHCIYPIGYNDSGICTKYCGIISSFENICSTHIDYISEIITNTLNMLPKDLISICTDYYFVKMTISNWNTDEMRKFRNEENKKFKINNIPLFKYSDVISDSDSDSENHSNNAMLNLLFGDPIFYDNT